MNKEEIGGEQMMSGFPPFFVIMNSQKGKRKTSQMKSVFVSK